MALEVTKEDMISRAFRYEQIQENYDYIKGRLKTDEVQDECIRYLAEYRQLDYETLRSEGVFYAETTDELELIAGYDEDAIYYLGFSNKFMDYRNRYMFPVLSGSGKLHAWNGYDYESKSKYLVGLLGVGDKKRLMYGIHDIQQAYDEDTIIVTEGTFERIRLKEMGLNVGVSMLGKKMSPWHKQFLNRFKNVILIPDGDDEGQMMIDQWAKDLTSNVAIVKIKMVEKDFVYPEETIRKTAKDLDDKLRADELEQQRFITLYESLKDRLRTSRRVTVEF